MTSGEAGYFPRASPAGGRSTTKLPAAAGAVEPELGPSWRKSINTRVTRLLSGRQPSSSRAPNVGSVEQGLILVGLRPRRARSQANSSTHVSDRRDARPAESPGKLT